MDILELRKWRDADYPGLDGTQKRREALDNPERFGFPELWRGLSKLDKMRFGLELMTGFRVLDRGECTEAELNEHLEGKLAELAARNDGLDFPEEI